MSDPIPLQIPIEAIPTSVKSNDKIEWTCRIRNYHLVIIAMGVLSLSIYSITKLF
jgi:hypothetical protein